MEGYDDRTYGERFADVYDAWYPAPADLEACLDTVAAEVARAGGGPVLELGVGTGRIAAPLAARGLEVHGLDSSPAMLARLRQRPGGRAVLAVEGDMARLELPPGAPRFAVVLAAANTLFNLRSEDLQRRCLTRCAQVLAPGGSLLLEAFVPAEDGPTSAVEPRRITADEVVLSVSQADRESQTVVGQHVQISEQGIRLRPWRLRWATPPQLDAMAREAGLGLRWRAASWSGEPFGADSDAHVSCYGRD